MTARTGAKPLLCARHVFGHPFFRGGGGDVEQLEVALGAALEEMGASVEAEGGDDLHQLFAEVIALDEEMRQLEAAQEVAPSREDDAAFRARQAQQGAATQMGSVGGVIAEEAQPSGKSPEHGVDGESRLRGHVAATIAI